VTTSRCVVVIVAVVTTLACELAQQVFDLVQLPVPPHDQSSAGERSG
jgi:hypothetical protein